MNFYVQMKKWKILTHDDLDGVVSAVLLSIKLNTNQIKFEDSNKKTIVDKNTAVADIPYHNRCGMWFDHHISAKINKKFKGKFALEKSCSRVIYNYFNKKFQGYYKKLVNKVDKGDSGNYTISDIKTYNKIYLLDQIGFLSLFKDRKENLLFLYKLFNHFRNQKSFDSLFKNIFIKKLVKRVKELDKKTLLFIKKKGIIKNDVLIINSTDKTRRFSNFFIFTKYPKCRYIITMSKWKNKIGILITFNKLFFRNNPSNIGMICKRYNGGGHKGIGGFTINKKNKEKVLEEILKQLK